MTPSTPVAPTLEPTPAPVEAGPSVGDQANRGSLGWSPVGAVVGFTGTGVVVSTGIIAMVFLIFGPNSSTTAPGLIFMLASAASTAGLGALAHAGAQSALTDPANEGAPGVAYAGWGFYAASLAASVASMVLWFVPNQSITAFFTQLGALVSGALALLFFGIEAVECGTNAIRLRKANTARRADLPVRVMPTFSFAARADGRMPDPVLGLSGAF